MCAALGIFFTFSFFAPTAAVAQAVPSQNESNELIDLMDVMLDDFLNPRTPPVEREAQQNRSNKTVPQVESAPVYVVPQSRYVPNQALPQTAEPPVTPYSDPYADPYYRGQPVQPVTPITPQTVPQTFVPVTPPVTAPVPGAQTPLAPSTSVQPEAAQVDTTKPRALIIPPPQAEQTPENTQSATVPQSIESAPLPATAEAQPVQVQQQEPAPLSPVGGNAVATEETDTDDADYIEEDDEELSIAVEEEEKPFDRVSTLAFSPLQFNSYNSSFGSIGVDFAFERAVKHNAAFGLVGGIDYAYSQTGAKDRIKDLFKGNFKNHLVSFKDAIFTAEAALFYRFYIMNDSMKEARSYPFGFFLQPELGVAVGFNKSGLVADQLNLKPSPLASLRTGYRGYIGDSFFIEPYVRVGYPFIAGGGIGIGLQL